METDGGVGPLRRALRRRVEQRAGVTAPEDLEPGTLELGGRHRTYLLAAPSIPAAPMLIVLHGAGATGAGMARLTGLGGRARTAGVAAVFPDGVGRVWNDDRNARRLRQRENVDDVGFLAALIERLATAGVIDPHRVVLAGMSNGALLAEHIVRHARLPAAGLVLVAGTATVPSREAQPLPRQSADVLVFHGTADPLVPYLGGPIGPIGPAGRMAHRRARRTGAGHPGRGLAVAAETVAADWAAAAGAQPAPETARLPMPAGDLPVTRMTWRGAAHTVTLHRIEGGGHTWPGGPQYLPARIVGPVTVNLDASAAAIAVAAGR
jgi:polyhydroxybutyrate depolymerase